MGLKVRVICTAVCSVLLMPAFLLQAREPAPPAVGTNNVNAVDSSSTSAAEPVAALPAASSETAAPASDDWGIHTPKAELFVGYSYLRVVPALDEGNRLVWLNGGSASIAFNFNRYLGLVADFGGFKNSAVEFTGANSSNVKDANGTVLTYLFGPRISFRNHRRFTPFVQVLAGGMHASDVTLSNCTISCTVLPTENTFALAGGGGIDVRLRRHLALRLIQAEYVMTRFEDPNTGVKANQNDMRLSAGLVFRFGGPKAPPPPPPLPVSYSCSVSPMSVFPGETIVATGTALNLDPAKMAVYTWSADGGVVTGISSSAKIDTANATAGTYTLKGHVSEGDKPGENADCTAPYSVKAYEPPTVSCSATPSSVTSGDPSTITATAVSPQSRPLTYSYSSTSGTVSGTGPTAILSTTGSALGAVGVTCTVVDDKGQTGSGTTSVSVTAPVVAPKPMTSELCSIQFGRDDRRPARVNNEAKACLDEIALSLQRSSDARLALVGNASSNEKGRKKLAAERAVNSKVYLVSEKGIDSSRISLYTGSQDGKTTSATLIPTGATLDATGDTVVDESRKVTHPARRTSK